MYGREKLSFCYKLTIVAFPSPPTNTTIKSGPFGKPLIWESFAWNLKQVMRIIPQCEASSMGNSLHTSLHDCLVLKV